MQLLQYYLDVFNPLPCNTQGELIRRLRHMLIGGPVLQETVNHALTMISNQCLTSSPVLLTIGEFCDIVMADHKLPPLYSEYFDNKSLCFAQALQVNYHYLFLLTISEWLFGHHSRLEFDLGYLADVTDAVYSSLHDHIAEHHRQGKSITVAETHQLLRRNLFEAVTMTNEIYVNVASVEL